MKEYNPDLLGQSMEMRKIVKCVVDKLSVVDAAKIVFKNIHRILIFR